MAPPAIIAPSMLASDFARMAEEAAKVMGAGADWARVGTFHTFCFAAKTPIDDTRMVHVTNRVTPPGSGSDNPRRALWWKTPADDSLYAPCDQRHQLATASMSM
jgi:hypothetical protein